MFVTSEGLDEFSSVEGFSESIKQEASVEGNSRWVHRSSSRGSEDITGSHVIVGKEYFLCPS